MMDLQGAVKRVHHQAPKQDDNSMAVTPVTPSDGKIVDVQPLQVSRDMVQIPSPKRSIVRGDNLIMAAISSLNELHGSNETTIADFIENHYKVRADFKKLLSAKLKSLTSSGKLIKMKPRYMIATTSMKLDKDEIHSRPQSEMDLEVEKIMSMSAREAATYAAQAVAEAEAFLEEDEEATKEAEVAEAYADAAEAARKKLKGRSNPKNDDPCV